MEKATHPVTERSFIWYVFNMSSRNNSMESSVINLNIKNSCVVSDLFSSLDIELLIWSIRWILRQQLHYLVNLLNIYLVD
jgi:hypothetical protein